MRDKFSQEILASKARSLISISEIEREEEKRKKKNLEGQNGTYIELFVDSPPQCYFACPLLVACLYF